MPALRYVVHVNRVLEEVQAPSFTHFPEGQLWYKPVTVEMLHYYLHNTNHRLRRPGLRFKSPQHCKRPIFDYEAA